MSQIERFQTLIKRDTQSGNYSGGLKHARTALKLFPNDFAIQFLYAKLLGDWADELPPKEKKKHKRESLKIIRSLVRRLRGKSLELRFGVSLNLYYQAEDFLGMVRFGRRFQSAWRAKGIYATALGACLHAQKLYQAGRTRPAATWAKRSVEAWKKYDLQKDRYYFAHYSFAKALALSGDVRGAQSALSKAAKLARRPLSDWEFADVLQILKERKTASYSKREK